MSFALFEFDDNEHGTTSVKKIYCFKVVISKVTM